MGDLASAQNIDAEQNPYVKIAYRRVRVVPAGREYDCTCAQSGDQKAETEALVVQAKAKRVTTRSDCTRLVYASVDRMA